MAHEQLDLRPLRLANFSVARAFALSLLLHALLFLTLETGFKFGLWKATLLFPKSAAKTEAEMARLLAARQQQEEPPLVFVEVDPSLATAEAPKEAKYYSALNSRAANPDTRIDTPIPKVDGKQEHVPQTQEQAKPEAQPLQPAPVPPTAQPAEAKPEPQTPPPPQPPQLAPAPAPEPPPEPQVRPGDLAFAKPPEKPPQTSESKRSELTEPRKPAPIRARTLEAKRREKGVAGEKMKQQGGVKRFGLEPSFDVKATPFGAYDSAIIAAIQKRWYDLLNTRDFSATYSGKVIVEFRLNSDGRVTELKVSQNEVTEILGLLCQRAVQDPAPFAAWPPDLRRLVGKEFREVRFTFYYN
jgi:outer membrane biosynthesis protein TonB